MRVPVLEYGHSLQRPVLKKQYGTYSSMLVGMAYGILQKKNTKHVYSHGIPVSVYTGTRPGSMLPR